MDALGAYDEERKFFSTGSGSPVALGVLEDGYRDDMTTSQAISLVVRAIQGAMKRDVATGESFDVAVITSSGYRELSESEKSQILTGA